MSRARLALALAVVLVADLRGARVAAADPITTTPAAPTTPVEPDDKSPDMALGLSIGATALGAGLTAAGFATHSYATGVTGASIAFLGPTAGHWYAGEPFTWGLGARLLGVGVFALGASQIRLSFFDSSSQSQPDNTGAALFMLGGLALIGGGTIYDIATAPGAADHANQRRHAHDLSIAPTVIRGAAGSTAPGFALVGSF